MDVLNLTGSAQSSAGMDDGSIPAFEEDDVNGSSENGNWTDQQVNLLYRHSPAVTIVYCIAYVIVFVVGLVGNCLVVAVVVRAPRMRTVTNFFIVNLAVADVLVVLFCLPATLLSNIFVPWVLGGVACKMVAYVQGVSVVASVDSLVAVSIDRVLAICFPMRFQITGRRARLIILFIWVLALTTTLPWPMYFHLVSAFPSEPEIQLCVEEWPEGAENQQTVYFIVANVVFCYLFPLTLICLCYVMIWFKVWSRSIPTENKDAQLERIQQRSKVKVVKMLVVVVIIFMLSWLPLYAIFIRIKLGGESMEPWEERLLSFATPIAQWLGASNSCVNPVLYAYFNQKYRRGFRAIVQSRSCCGDIRTTVDYNATFSDASVQHRLRKNLSSVNSSTVRSLRTTGNRPPWPKGESTELAEEVAQPLNGSHHPQQPKWRS